MNNAEIRDAVSRLVELAVSTKAVALAPKPPVLREPATKAERQEHTERLLDYKADLQEVKDQREALTLATGLVAQFLVDIHTIAVAQDDLSNA